MARLFGESAEHGTRGTCAPRSSSLLDVKNNVGEAETYLASPGGADDPPQFVCAFQRLRIGFV